MIQCDFDFFDVIAILSVGVLKVFFPTGTMEDWDQDTLEKVVAEKNMEYNHNKPTDIVCFQPYFPKF